MSGRRMEDRKTKFSSSPVIYPEEFVFSCRKVSLFRGNKKFQAVLLFCLYIFDNIFMAGNVPVPVIL